MQQSPVMIQTISALKKADLSSHEVALIIKTALKKIDRFEPADIALCTSALLSTLRAIPLSDTIYTVPSTGRMYIRGKLVKDVQIQKRLIEQANQLQRNVVRKLIREKVAFEATDIGMRKATDLWDIVFGKAALWFMQQEDLFLGQITGASEVADSDDE